MRCGDRGGVTANATVIATAAVDVVLQVTPAGALAPEQAVRARVLVPLPQCYSLPQLLAASTASHASSA